MLLGETAFDSTGNKKHIYKWEHDERGRLTGYSFCDGNEKPIITPYDDFSTCKLEYNNYGYRVKESYYGLEGQLVPNAFGVATKVYEYDNKGNKIKETYFDTQGMPVLDRNSKAAAISQEFDDSGNQISRTSYDINGKVIAHKEIW